MGGGLRLFQNKYVSYRVDVTDNFVVNSKRLNQVISIQLMLALNIGVGE